jgi:hypothetical protein
MDFDVMPGPPLPELARTTMARAVSATVSCAGSRELPPATVPIRSDRAGRPVLVPDSESTLARHLATRPVTVTVAVPAAAPFSALRLTGITRPAQASPAPAPGAAHAAGRIAYPVSLRAVEFTGGVAAPVAVDRYETAAPDPFWREAPAILRHLEHCHTADLVSCVRAHGLTAAEYVIPRGLDRFGLELLVMSDSGLASVRLAYPGGPVTTVHEVPVSIRALLTCRCGERHHQPG